MRDPDGVVERLGPVYKMKMPITFTPYLVAACCYLSRIHSSSPMR